MKIGKSHHLFFTSLTPPADSADGGYAAEFGQRHPRGYLLIDHASVQWRLPHGRIRAVHLVRETNPPKGRRP